MTISRSLCVRSDAITLTKTPTNKPNRKKQSVEQSEIAAHIHFDYHIFSVCFTLLLFHSASINTFCFFFVFKSTIAGRAHSHTTTRKKTATAATIIPPIDGESEFFWKKSLIMKNELDPRCVRAHGGSKCAKQGIQSINQPTNQLQNVHKSSATRTYYFMQNKKGSATTTTPKKHCDLTFDSHENTHNWNIS